MTTLDYAKARELMVEQQIRPWDVLLPRVLDVLSTTPREPFIPAAHRTLAYADVALPLGHGQFTLKPVIEGRILQALDLGPDDEVLEIGTGSGFLTACMARLAREVHSLELHEDIAAAARAALASQRADNVRVETADAFAWTSGRRFDAICVGGAAAEVPVRFLEWLKPGGRMFVVHGRAPAMDAALVRGDVNAMRIESLFETDIPYLVGAAPVPTFQL
ncbi:MAG TPA: protein-L-isoaspartate O-methyltransferase [Lysobacter sp.]